MNSLYSFLMVLFSPSTTIVALLLVFTLLCLLLVLYSQFNNTLSISYFRIWALIISFVPLFWSLYIWILYDGSGETFQCICNISSIHLSFGVDAVGLALVVLTTAILPLCIILMRTFTGIITFLLLELVILGSLLVLDLLGFYLLFEASLILLFLLIARPERLSNIQYSDYRSIRNSYGTVDAAYKIVLYTMAGSLAFLPVIFILYSNYGTTNILLLTCCNSSILSVDSQMILGWGLLAVFAVKIPLIPVHLWLPEAHVAAPTAGSILLAGVLLKLGGLGFIRYLIPIFPLFVVKVFPLMVGVCFISFLYATLSCIRQVDLKKIVAYSSIAHMSLVSLAIFSMSENSIGSSTFMMIAHGLVSPGLFLLVGFLYERSHTKFIPYFSGLASHMPIYATLFFLLTLANLSFPLFPNFIAEVFCLLSLFAVHSLYAYIFCICQILGAVYGFWTYARVMHGYNTNTFSNIRHSTPFNAGSSIYSAPTVIDLSRKELIYISPIMIGIFWLGLKPMA